MSRQNYDQAMKVTYTYMGDLNTAVFFCPNGTANQAMKITYNDEESLTIAHQDDDMTINVEFFYSTNRVRDGQALIDSRGIASTLQILKVRLWVVL